MRIRFLSSGPIDQISGGYLYNKYLVEHLRQAGLDVFYHADVAGLTQTDERDVVIADSIALPGSLTHLLEARACIVLLLHVVPDPWVVAPSEPQRLTALYRRSRVVVTGNSSLTTLRDRLEEDGVETVKIEPGVPAHWKVKRCHTDRPSRLLAVANYLQNKGIWRLLRVMHEVRDLPWHLTVHGNPDFDPDHHRSMLEMVERLGLLGRVDLLGPVPHDQVNHEMIAADLLLHFSEHESYSMATAEAIACGLPVLSYRSGNAASFARSGLVRHVAEGAEVDAVRSLIERPDVYAGLRRSGRRRVRTWQDVGDEFIDWLGV
jgi:glycosyltransferase involved in cell wall biosynthesis